jgi:hypothetical protein
MPCVPLIRQADVGLVCMEPKVHYPDCEPGDCFCQMRRFEELDRQAPRPPMDDYDPIGDDPNPEREPF